MARANTSPPASPPIDGATNVGPGIRISGRVTGEEDLHVEGRIDGAIQLSDTLFVAPGGIVAAEVEAHNVVVSGVIVGNVTARDCVTLHAGAKLVGDITAPRLVIADGAAFKGNVRMGGEPLPAREKSRSAARPRPVATGLRGVAAANRAPSPPARSERRVPPRPAPRAEPAPVSRAADEPRSDEEDTVIVRHAAVPDEGRRGASGKFTARGGREEKHEKVVEKAAKEPAAPAAKAAARSATKKSLPPRARIPKPGKRRVGRR
jgi:cytoskeletal protein CcmA (bactofilin family)